MIKIYLDKDYNPTSKLKAKYMQVRIGEKVMFVALKKKRKPENGQTVVR